MDVQTRDPESGKVTKAFREGLDQFMQHTSNQPFAQDNGNMIFCLCVKCENTHYWQADIVGSIYIPNGFCQIIMSGFRMEKILLSMFRVVLVQIIKSMKMNI